MIGTIAGALTSLKATTELARVAIDARDSTKLQEARSAMIDRIIDVQDACMRLQEANSTMQQEKHALTQENRTLEDKIKWLEQRATRLASYELTNTPAGSTVYMEKGKATGSQNAKYICATCAERGDIAYLQPESNWYWLTCPTHGKVQFSQNTDTGPMVMSSRGHDPYADF